MPGHVIDNFFIYSVINAFTPGPGNILALNTITNCGYKKEKLETMRDEEFAEVVLGYCSEVSLNETNIS